MLATGNWQQWYYVYMKSFRPELLKAAVYGANDGIITTFAVVAGVAGAGLSPQIVIILGIANMMADAFSMAVGDFLGEKSERQLRLSKGEKNVKSQAVWRTSVVTFGAFVVAGTMPLIPYVGELFGVRVGDGWRFPLAIIFTALALFVVGSLRTIVTKGSWIKNGLEMLSIGAIAAMVAYGLGFGVKQLVGDVGI